MLDSTSAIFRLLEEKPVINTLQERKSTGCLDRSGVRLWNKLAADLRRVVPGDAVPLTDQSPEAAVGVKGRLRNVEKRWRNRLPAS